MSNEFEKNIKKKLEKNLSSDFDQKFWTKFEQEKKSKKSLFFTFLLPAVGVALLAIFVMNKSTPAVQNVALDEIDEMQLLLDFDDDLITSQEEDADWDYILEENNS